MMTEDLEIHITISETDDVYRFKEYCAKKGFKSIILDLNGSFQCMSNQRYRLGDYRSILEQSKKELEELGFKPIRYKVEIKPKEMSNVNLLYYESHFRLILRFPTDIDQLVNFARKNSLHISKNLLKQTKDYSYQMLTLRDYDKDLSSFLAKVKEIENNLNTEGYTYDKVEVEACIYDSNIGLDDEWLKIK